MDPARRGILQPLVRYWLNRAVEEDWSVGRMREEINAAKAKPKKLTTDVVLTKVLDADKKRLFPGRRHDSASLGISCKLRSVQCSFHEVT